MILIWPKPGFSGQRRNRADKMEVGAGFSWGGTSEKIFSSVQTWFAFFRTGITPPPQVWGPTTKPSVDFPPVFYPPGLGINKAAKGPAAPVLTKTKQTPPRKPTPPPNPPKIHKNPPHPTKKITQRGLSPPLNTATPPRPRPPAPPPPTKFRPPPRHLFPLLHSPPPFFASPVKICASSLF